MPLAAVRCLGLLAAIGLAVVGRLGGALPSGDVASTPASIARGPHGPAILCGWLVGTVLLAYAWWAVRDRIPSARWAVVTASLWAAPFLVAPAMGSRDLYSYACQGYLYVHGVNPYGSGVNALPCPWIESVSPIWRDTAAPYGPMFVLCAAAVVWLAGDSLIGVMAGFRVIAVLGMAAVAAGVPVLARRCGVPAKRALWVALAGPLIGAQVIAGPHNDALMIGLLVAGLAVAAGSTGRPSSSLTSGAGVLLGLAVAVKVTAIVVLPFAVLVVLVPPYRRRQVAGAAGRLVGGAVAAMVVVTAGSGLGFGWIAGLVNTRDLVQFTSPPTAVGMTLTYLFKPLIPGFDAVPAVRALAAFLLLVVLAALVWHAATRPGPRPASAVPATAGPADAPDRAQGWVQPSDPVAAALRGAALAMAATVALSPYFHPWYALWPLVLLAGTTMRTRLVMAASTAGPLLVLPDGGGLARFVKFPGAPVVTVFLACLLIRLVRRAPGQPGGRAWRLTTTAAWRLPRDLFLRRI